MIDINNLLIGLVLIFCTVGPFIMVVGLLLYKEIFPPINIVNYIEDIPKIEGLYNAVEVGRFYLVFQKNGNWYRVNTDSRGKVHLRNPRRF